MGNSDFSRETVPVNFFLMAFIDRENIERVGQKDGGKECRKFVECY